MENLSEFLRQGPQLITTWYPTVDVLLQYIRAGELVVCLSAVGRYLGIYQTELDRDRTTPTQVAFTGRCWLERTEYACRVEIRCESRQGHVWLTAPVA